MIIYDDENHDNHYPDHDDDHHHKDDHNDHEAILPLSECEGAQNSALFGYLWGTACMSLNTKTSTSISHIFKNITFRFHLRKVISRQRI